MFDITVVGHDEIPWDLVGPLFCSRVVHRELGIAVTTSPEHVWFLAFSGENVAGFAAVEHKKSKAIFRHAYVVSAYRDKGLYALLLEKRERYIFSKNKPCLMETVASQNSAGWLQKQGWIEQRRRGKYCVMHKEVLGE